MSLKTLDHLSETSLISSDDLAGIFEIEPLREHGSVHQITKEHRDLTALGLRFRR